VGNGTQRIFQLRAQQTIVTVLAGRYNDFSANPPERLLLDYIIRHCRQRRYPNARRDCDIRASGAREPMLGGVCEGARARVPELQDPASESRDMSDIVENLILDLIEWVGRRERTYQETIDAWRTSCPKLPVWEDATERGLVETAAANGRSLVQVTSAGLAFLKEKRPRAYEDLPD
jgi:hypothetical protein